MSKEEELLPGEIKTVGRGELLGDPDRFQEALNSAIAAMPGRQNVNTYGEYKDSILDNWAWTFKDGRTIMLVACDTTRLLEVIETLVERIRFFESSRNAPTESR